MMKILIVDDESDVKFLFEQRFRKEIKNGELSLMFATSGLDALNVLDDKQDIPLVLSDINMPGMNGIDLLQKIKALPRISSPDVIMITAYADQDNYYDRCKSLGAEDLLAKPLDFNLLKAKINSKQNSFLS